MHLLMFMHTFSCIISLLLFWSGTCLKEVSTDLLVWLTLAVYIGIRIVANMIDYVPDSVALLEKTNVGILGGFLSFFLVLFVNQTNARFLEMYGFSKACVSLVYLFWCIYVHIMCLKIYLTSLKVWTYPRCGWISAYSITKGHGR